MYQQRHVGREPVQVDVVPEVAELTQRFTVVREHDHERVAQIREALELTPQPTDLRVDLVHEIAVADARCLHGALAAPDALRGVRLEVVDPCEHTVLARARLAQALQEPRGRTLGVREVRGRCALCQQLRHRRALEPTHARERDQRVLKQRARLREQVVRLLGREHHLARALAGERRAEREQCRGIGGDGALERQALGLNVAQVGRDRLAGAVVHLQGVFAQRVDADQDHVAMTEQLGRSARARR